MSAWRMLRMYIAQECFGLSDEGMEYAIYDSQAIRGFVGIDLNREAAPDVTTLLEFRRMLETHRLTSGILDTINSFSSAKMLIAQRRQHCRCHSYHCTDIHQKQQGRTGSGHALLHGEEKVVFGDAEYQGCDQRTENRAKETEWQLGLRPGKRKGLADTA